MDLLLGCLDALGAARCGGVVLWAHNDGHVNALRLSYTAPARETPGKSGVRTLSDAALDAAWNDLRLRVSILHTGP